jgi:predicted enzyme related to lactoylglutathione lyase
MRIKCIERVIVATPSIDEARDRWSRSGFAVSATDREVDGIRFARLAAGAIEIDLAEAKKTVRGPLAEAVALAASRGGGIVGWTWGTEDGDGQAQAKVQLPGFKSELEGSVTSAGLPGVFTAALQVNSGLEARNELYRRELGGNPNTVDFLEHIVVMTPVLEDAIAAQEAIGVPCKRIREVGNGVRQAFFKLEQTVIEVVGPARDRPGCWGLAFMCGDIAKAVATARANSLQATEPKKAIQGGQIARIVDPLDGVAVAFMRAAG